MPSSNADLFSLRGRVMNFRKGVLAPQVDAWINDRIRQVIDLRTYWADLLGFGVLSIPAKYDTGTVSVTRGSKTVTGVATSWPVDDVVDTTIADEIAEIGYVEVAPASLTGITVDSLLYVDAAGDPEAVPVMQVKPEAGTFIAKFTKFHNAGATVTQSSLAGRQLRLGDGYPVFTVRAVVSTTSLLIDVEWGGSSLTDNAYEIVKIYYTLDPNLKAIQNMVDSQWGWPVRLHVSQTEIDWRDPRRSATGISGVLSLVDYIPNENGNMQYAIWPPVTSEKQLPFIFTKQWPELVEDTDRPPWFINPTLFYHGALADALRYRAGKDDPFHNPRLADDYEQRFQAGVVQASLADEEKAQRAYEFAYHRVFGAFGANFLQSHDPDVMQGTWT